MPIKVNLRHLEEKSVEISGEITPEELELESMDEMVQVKEPLIYDLEVERQNDNLLVHGSLTMNLDCECVRCLKPFKHQIVLDPWDAIIPLAGEDAVKVDNDLVDLTPYIREDTLLEFPQHPLCKTDCSGLQRKAETEKQSSGTGKTNEGSSAWAELNKLKF